MTEERKPKRIRERLELKLPIRVFCRESADLEWVEMTRLINVTPFGCGFTLKRPIEVGRLLHLTIPMPRQLRVFDHLEDQYKVWALVRYAKGLIKDQATLFDVGVAFIGKRPPLSYESEPWRRYEASATSLQSMDSPDRSMREFPATDERLYTRHHMAVDMLLEVMNEKGEVTETESSVTENISRKGATIFTTLSVPPGRFVRLTSQQFNLTTYAVVRTRNIAADGVPRIHVEFIDIEWPL
ncbi:MAG TPA: PilZ domain-containing protein [Pyrinomonadaceae bacterium]|nr:PilZ domain-containing protein [Pyrinomonadaceae bacterium]